MIFAHAHRLASCACVGSRYSVLLPSAALSNRLKPGEPVLLLSSLAQRASLFPYQAVVCLQVIRHQNSLTSRSGLQPTRRDVTHTIACSHFCKAQIQILFAADLLSFGSYFKLLSKCIAGLVRAPIDRGPMKAEISAGHNEDVVNEWANGVACVLITICRTETIWDTAGSRVFHHKR